MWSAETNPSKVHFTHTHSLSPSQGCPPFLGTSQNQRKVSTYQLPQLLTLQLVHKRHRESEWPWQLEKAKQSGGNCRNFHKAPSKFSSTSLGFMWGIKCLCLYCLSLTHLDGASDRDLILPSLCSLKDHILVKEGDLPFITSHWCSLESSTPFEVYYCL